MVYFAYKHLPWSQVGIHLVFMWFQLTRRESDGGKKESCKTTLPQRRVTLVNRLEWMNKHSFIIYYYYFIAFLMSTNCCTYHMTQNFFDASKQ